MKQERVPVRRKRAPKPEVVEEVAGEDAEAGLLNDIDALLDEIDAVLEEQVVLVNFRQRSGQ
jgi:hypothetical protein